MALRQVEDIETPECLHMRIFEPGMTVLHRVGLAGLACTLKQIERASEQGASNEELPGGPWENGPPWAIDEQSVTLRFGNPRRARKYLKRLFRLAFQIRDGLIYLPGQYGELAPSLEVRAALQEGLLLSFYDHGPQSRGLGSQTEMTIEVDEKPIAIRYPRMTWYKHGRQGAELAFEALTGSVPVSRMLFPGAIVRHDRWKNSAAAMTANLLIPLLFAPIGCFALRAGGRRVKVKGKRVFKPGAAVIMPDFADLTQAPSILSVILPHHVKQTKVGSVSDAALAAELRLRARDLLNIPALSGIRAVWCCATDWSSRLQPPSRILELSPRELANRELDRYEIALAELQPKVISRQVEESQGRGRTKRTVIREEHFLTDSTVRPLIADNLASGKWWYQNFARLMRDKDTAKKTSYEKRGLQTMANTPALTENDETQFIRALHRAIFMARGKIYGDVVGREAAKRKVPATPVVKKRWSNFMERLRLDIVGAKTANQVHEKINKLLARTGTVRELRDDESRELVRKLLFSSEWQRVQSLALFALASYKRPVDVESVPGDDDDQEQNP